MKDFKSLSLPLGGIQFDLFLTRDSSFSFALHSKYSNSLICCVNSIMSSFHSCMFGFVGVGVNFEPFSNSLISLSLSFLDDKLLFVYLLHAICCFTADCLSTNNHLISNLY